MESICSDLSFLSELEGGIIRNGKESCYKTSKVLDNYSSQQIFIECLQ